MLCGLGILSLASYFIPIPEKPVIVPKNENGVQTQIGGEDGFFRQLYFDPSDNKTLIGELRISGNEAFYAETKGNGTLSCRRTFPITPGSSVEDIKRAGLDACSNPNAPTAPDGTIFDTAAVQRNTVRELTR